MNTKIYGTIGPACCDKDTLVRLFEKGMTGVRLNLSHSNLPEAGDWILKIREAYREHMGRYGQDSEREDYAHGTGCGGPEILMDLKGPELRTGKREAECILKEGDSLILAGEGSRTLPSAENGSWGPDNFVNVHVTVPEMILPHLVEGQEILLDDGKILLIAEERRPGNPEGKGEQKIAVKCRVIRGGVLKSSKSIALPGKKLHPPTLTESDLLNIAAAKEYGITGVMLPFVRGPEDLLNLKEVLLTNGADDIRIFAKIENRDGADCLKRLLPYCDEVVIARGDLGNDVPLWELPVLQERIAAVCKREKKPFMVVTQMLASMESAPVPTRAEVSDIFRAVDEGAASVMLTGETAAGQYPVAAMEYLSNTVREAEKYKLGISRK